MNFGPIIKDAATLAALVSLMVGNAAFSAEKRSAAGDKPAVSTDADLPAVITTPGASPAAKGAASNGTTIIGERESPIGLYITPWRNAAAEVDIDRPARLLSVRTESLDRKVFSRQIDYYEALTAAQAAKTVVPAAPSAAP